MRILLKYGLLTIVVFCLNLSVTEVLDVCRQSEQTFTTSETQLIAYQAQTTRQAISNFYDQCPDMPCDIVHISHDLPAVKYVLLTTNPYNKIIPEQKIKGKTHSHSSLLHSLHPNAYYVFGLRKIVI